MQQNDRYPVAAGCRSGVSIFPFSRNFNRRGRCSRMTVSRPQEWTLWPTTNIWVGWPLQPLSAHLRAYYLLGDSALQHMPHAPWYMTCVSRHIYHSRHTHIMYSLPTSVRRNANAATHATYAISITCNTHITHRTYHTQHTHITCSLPTSESIASSVTRNAATLPPPNGVHITHPAS